MSGSFEIVLAVSPYSRFGRLNIIRDDWDDRDDHMHRNQALASCSL